MKVPVRELKTALKLLREVNGLTQNELAKLANLRQASISHVELNIGGYNVKTIKLISDALGYDLYFCFEKKDKKQQLEQLPENSGITFE